MRMLPFVSFFPAAVYCSLLLGCSGSIGFVSNKALLGTTKVSDMKNGKSVCEHAGGTRWELPKDVGLKPFFPRDFQKMFFGFKNWFLSVCGGGWKSLN